MQKRAKEHIPETVPIDIVVQEEEVVPYVPDAPDLRTTLLGGSICTIIIFLLCNDHTFVTKAFLSICTIGLFLLRYLMGIICPDPYAPVTEAEYAEATDMGFAGDPEFRER